MRLLKKKVAEKSEEVVEEKEMKKQPLKIFIDDTYFISYEAMNIVVKTRREKGEIPEQFKKHIKKKENPTEDDKYKEEVIGYYSNLPDALEFGFSRNKLNESGAQNIAELKAIVSTVRNDIAHLFDKHKHALAVYPQPGSYNVED